MTKENWQAIYARGEQLNLYPYDFIVSNFFRYRNRFIEKHGSERRMKVLDLGCGGGNHTLFCAENGALVYAVDYSESALQVVADRARERHLDQYVETKRLDFDNFDLREEGFDLVIDRLAVTNIPMENANRLYRALEPHLNEGALILANFFSTEHSHKDYGQHCQDKKIWNNFTDGIFKPLKTACFYKPDEIRSLFLPYRLKVLIKQTEDNLIDHGEKKVVWMIVAEKHTML